MLEEWSFPLELCNLLSVLSWIYYFVVTFCLTSAEVLITGRQFFTTLVYFVVMWLLLPVVSIHL